MNYEDIIQAIPENDQNCFLIKDDSIQFDEEMVLVEDQSDGN